MEMKTQACFSPLCNRWRMLAVIRMMATACMEVIRLAHARCDGSMATTSHWPWSKVRDDDGLALILQGYFGGGTQVLWWVQYGMREGFVLWYRTVERKQKSQVNNEHWWSTWPCWCQSNHSHAPLIVGGKWEVSWGLVFCIMALTWSWKHNRRGSTCMTVMMKCGEREKGNYWDDG